MRPLCQGRVLDDHRQIVTKRALPFVYAMALQMGINLLEDIHKRPQPFHPARDQAQAGRKGLESRLAVERSARISQLQHSGGGCSRPKQAFRAVEAVKDHRQQAIGNCGQRGALESFFSIDLS
jgi:hypothetical protein